VDPFVGRILSKKYRIDSRLSVGGFGIVFMATQVHQGQDIGGVVIKMLHPEHALDPVVTRRFINEVKAARQINSPHVTKIFDMDFDQGNVPYMVQEFVEGGGLADILEKQGAIDLARAVGIAQQVAEGMEEAHAKAIIHRDLKPENILIQRLKRNDYVKIIDFGIARVTTAEGLKTTSFVGTPRYMPPEQIKGKELDGRADIYALGVILFEMIAGRPPIEVKDSDMEYLTLNLTQEPEPLRKYVPEAPERLDDLIQMMIAKEPDERPADMGFIIKELDLISREAGYLAEITGEHSVPTDVADTKVDAKTRDLIKTPTPDDLEEKKEKRQVGRPSESFTDERPASAQHDRSRGVNLPLLAVVAGLVAFAVVGVIGAVLITGRFVRGGAADPDRSGSSPAKVNKVRPQTPAPDAAVDIAPEPPPTEAPVTPPEPEPPGPSEPPAKKPKTVIPPAKKPPAKKPPIKKPTVEKKNTGDPWTKL
jgi:serine/threonine-protein kinase